jgi:plasmid maintenance system antidote protein VapI
MAALSKLVRGDTGVTPLMALRLARVLPGEDSAADWLARQAAYDLWKCEQAMGPKLQSLTPIGGPKGRRRG